MKRITPGSKVKIISGKQKGMDKTVFMHKGSWVYLKDYLKNSMSKKLYQVKKHQSSVKILERNRKEPTSS